MSTIKTIQYPKFVTLAFGYLLAFALYREGIFHTLIEPLQGYGYITAFLTGVFFSYGFTSGFAVAVFVEEASILQPFPAAVLAGIGATVSDLTLFEFLRVSFADEWKRFRASAPYQWVRRHVHRITPQERARICVKWLLACMIIASPLPDELGIAMVNGMALRMRKRQFGILCFLLNTAGIFAILTAARAMH